MNWTTFCDERLKSAGTIALPETLRLPRPPGSVAKFLQVADGPDANLEKVAQTIETDPELTVRLLKVVNSCGVGLSTKVVSARQAVGMLGIRRCKMLVLSAALQAALRESGWYTVNGMLFQAECLERALFAKFAAESLGTDSEVAYAAALVQDLLLPFLLDEFPEVYARFGGDASSIAQFEQEKHGWTHEHLTGQLLRTWTFPDPAVAGVLTHHSLAWLQSQSVTSLTMLIPSAAAALLPDALRQEPQGIAGLVSLQETLPAFDFIAIADRVDEQLEQSSQRWRSTPLAKRLGNLAVVRIQQKSVDDWLGRSIGPYVLSRRLGEGGMGTVYLAQHTHLKRLAAVKLMKHSHLDPKCLTRFESEAALTSMLENPHTTMVYDYGETFSGAPYYVMEYLDGISLFDLVRVYGPQPESRVIHLLLQICESLSEAHARGLVHRDIKPENIMLCVRGGTNDFIKVLDFGLATLRTANPPQASGTRVVCGTPHYLSPEAILTPHDVDHLTDIYALGCTAYWLLSGTVPFQDESAINVLKMQVHDAPVPLSQVLGRSMAGDLERVVMACLEKSRGARPQGSDDLADLLMSCDDHGGWNSRLAGLWWDRNATPLSNVPQRRNTFCRTGALPMSASTPGSACRTMQISDDI